MNYQVGDKVRIVSSKIGGSWNPNGKMDKWLGKVMTIKNRCDSFGLTYRMLEDQEGWNWHEHMIECKVEEDIKEEVKMNKYNVGDFVKFDYENHFKGVGKIVNLDENDDYMPYLIELPEKYRGQGHDGGGRYGEYNYLWIGDRHISCKVENPDVTETITTDEVKIEVESTEVNPDLFLYKCNTKADGSIVLNKVKMLNLCFVKYNPNGKVYTFVNPTDKVLKEGTKVLVDSAGTDSVAYVVSSVKVQKKHAKDLLYAMTGKKGLELKYVLGVYETKTVKTEVEELVAFGG